MIKKNYNISIIREVKKMAETYPINIWINEERYQQLCQSGLQKLAKEVFADMRVLPVFCNNDQKKELLKQYPQAKYDHSTTKSIELLPAELKIKIFNEILNKKNLDVMGEILKEIK